jgi:hypothetical protein
MRIRRIGLVAVGAFALACIIYTAYEKKTQHKERNADVNPSAVYVIYTTAKSGTQGYVILAPEREDFQGIPCVKGSGVTGWLQNKKIHLPVEKITSIIECKSMEEWQESIKHHDEEHPER